MRAGEMRALTSGECAMASEVFGGRLALDGLAVFQAPRLPFHAMVPLGRTIVFSRWRAARDFSHAELGERGWFIHELAHCWQAREGAVLPLAKLSALGHRAYQYDLIAGKPLGAYNIEQQAEIVRHLFLARHGAPEAGAPLLGALQDVWAAA
jgi:capsular polysaccharide biosynthesis protein